RSRRPFEGDVRDQSAQELMVLPRRRGQIHGGAWEAALMSQHLQQGDVALAVAGEIGHVLGYAIAESERALLDQHPDRRRGDHLGVGVEEPQAVVARRRRLRLEPRLPEAAEERELAVARHGDLRAGIAPVADMSFDDRAEAVESLGTEVKRAGLGAIENERHELLPSILHVPLLLRTEAASA